MPLYNREDLETELDIIEQASQMLSGRVASGKMTGFQCLRAEEFLEQKVREAKGKLLRTRNLVADIRASEQRMFDAANYMRESPGELAKQALAACQREFKRMLARTRHNQSPFRVKLPDGEIAKISEVLSGTRMRES